MRDAIEGLPAEALAWRPPAQGFQHDHGPGRPFDAQHPLVAHDRARDAAPGTGPAFGVRRRDGWRRRAAGVLRPDGERSAGSGSTRRNPSMPAPNDPSPTTSPSRPRGRSSTRWSTSGSTSRRRSSRASSGSTRASGDRSPAVAVNLLVEVAPPALRPRPGRLLILRPVAEPDDADLGVGARGPESVQQLPLPMGDAEEPAAEPLVDRGEEDAASTPSRRRSPRTAPASSPPRPSRSRSCRAPRSARGTDGRRGAAEWTQTRWARARPSRPPNRTRGRGSSPRRWRSLGGVEDEELEPLREPGRRSASSRVDDPVDHLARDRPLREASDHPPVPDDVSELHARGAYRPGPAREPLAAK